LLDNIVNICRGSWLEEMPRPATPVVGPWRGCRLPYCR